MWSRESVWVMSKISAASLPFGGGGAQGGVVGEAGKLSRESVGAVEIGAGVGVSLRLRWLELVRLDKMEFATIAVRGARWRD